MYESDIREIKQLISDMRSRIKSQTDNGVSGQYATYHYIANSKDAKAWASGTKIGSDLLKELNRQEVWLKQFMDSTLKFTNIIEDHINRQSKINNSSIK